MCFSPKQRRWTADFLWQLIKHLHQHNCRRVLHVFSSMPVLINLHGHLWHLTGLSAALPKEMPDTLKSNLSWIQPQTWTIYTGTQTLDWAKAATPGCSSKGTSLGNSFLWRGAVWIFDATVDTFVSKELCRRLTWWLKPFKIINSGSRPLTCVNSQVLRSKVHACSLQWTTIFECAS